MCLARVGDGEENNDESGRHKVGVVSEVISDILNASTEFDIF